MKVKKIFNINEELDELLKEATKILDCKETVIFKSALLMYLRKILK